MHNLLFTALVWGLVAATPAGGNAADKQSVTNDQDETPAVTATVSDGEPARQDDAASPSAAADSADSVAPPQSWRSAFTLDGNWQVAGYGVSAFPVDAMGATLGQQVYADHRLRIHPEVQITPALKAIGEVDLLSGELVGDTTPDYPNLVHARDAHFGYKPSSIDPRALFLEWRPSFGLLRAGHQTSFWGLGMLANDGDKMQPWGGPRFQGDLVERVLFATRPFTPLNYDWRHIVVAIGGDLVYRDQSADLLEGDRAFQAVFAVTYAPENNDNRLGVYAVRRSQTDRDGYGLNVWVFDLHGRWVKSLATDATLRLEAEAAEIIGDTTMVRDLYYPRKKIYQTGVAAEAALQWNRWEGLLQTGFASGDTNPQDNVITSFEMDPEYRVGFILFQEVLAWQTAATGGHASDPIISGRPSPGARLVPTEGAVANAIYIAPTFNVHITPAFNVQAGVLWARSAAAFVDPYATTIVTGGMPTTIRGALPKSHDLGFEADLGAGYTFRDHLTVYLQAGRFFPGAAFDAPAEGSLEPTTPMDPVDRVLAGVNVNW